MIKKSFKKRLLFIGSGFIIIIGCLFYLFLDAFHDPNFRTMQDKISSTERVDLTGLRDLRASGGFSVSYADIKKRLSPIKGTKIIVDGISEFHGYINGIPTTMLGYHVSDAGLRHLLRRFIVTGTFEKRPDFVTNASEEAERHGFDYKNIKIASKSVLSDENVDDIVDFFDHLPDNVWLHFHCHHGTGRTSIMLVMLDIMRNAPKVALEDIVKRQHLLGSTDLFNTEKWKHGTYTKQQLENRKKLVEQFYDFVVQRKSGGIQRWSDWQRQQKNTGNT